MWISMPELSSLLGEEMALAISGALGGVEVYIPTRPDAKHKLAEIVGYEGLETLCAKFGGVAVIMPSTPSATRKERILSLLHKGKTRREIARECGVTERYVYYLAAATQNVKQPLRPTA